MIDKFITFKEPSEIEDTPHRKGGIIFRSHVLMTDGRHLVISDAQHGDGFVRIDETLVFPCDESGNITEWNEIGGGRFMRTDDVVNWLNSGEYSSD